MSTPAPLRQPPKVPRPTPAPVASSPAIESLTGQLSQAEDRRSILSRFWSQLAIDGGPLIEPARTDGQRIVTFIWRGSASAVYLFVNRLTDERNIERSRMNRLPGSDIWHLSYEMEVDWRASYCFCPVPVDPDDPHPSSTSASSGPATGDQVAIRVWLDAGVVDQLNPDTVRCRGDQLMSVVSLPAAPPQPWLTWRAESPAGSITARTLPATTGFAERTVWSYLPAGHSGDPGRLPVLVLLDGEVWLQRVSIARTLDNLIAAGRIPPTRVLLPDSLDIATRWTELGANPAVIDALADHLLPWADVRADPAQVTIAGNSLGGLTAVAAVLLRPDRFGRAVSVSGSVWWDPDDHGVPLLHRLAATAPAEAVNARVELQVGRQEWVLNSPTRVLARLLRERGCRAELVEYNGGHDFAWWRGSLADAMVRAADADAVRSSNPRSGSDSVLRVAGTPRSLHAARRSPRSGRAGATHEERDPKSEAPPRTRPRSGNPGRPTQLDVPHGQAGQGHR